MPPLDPPAAADDPTFVLEIPPGLHVCGVFQDGRSPREELDLKCRLQLRGGQFELPTSVATVDADILEGLEFGPDATPGTPLTKGVLHVAKQGSWEPGAVYYSFTFEQDWDAGGTLLRIRDYSGIYFRTVNGVPDPREKRLDEKTISQEVFLFGHVGPVDGERTIRFSSCGYPTLPLWEISVRLEGGHRALLHERHQIPMAGSGPAQLVEAEVWLGEAHILQKSYWRLVYAAEHHNWNEQYWVLFNEPVVLPAAEAAGEGAAETDEVWGLFLQEGFFEIPQWAALLGKDLNEIRPVEILSYSQLPDGEKPPPEFRRGEARADGTLDMSDAVAILGFLFLGDRAPDCLDAADADDSGFLDVSDPILILGYLYLGTFPPEAPFPDCGDDLTPDELESCEKGCYIGWHDSEWFKQPGTLDQLGLRHGRADFRSRARRGRKRYRSYR